MLFCRFSIGKEIRSGLADGNKITALSASCFDPRHAATGDRFNMDSVRLLAPCQPSKIVAVGLNYKDHADELGMEPPAEPVIFIKPSTSVIGPGDDIIYPEGVGRLDYEAELAIVIKKTAKDVAVEDAGEYIMGFTCLNDVTARDLQKRDGQWTRAKSFDTFCPVGPFIASGIDPDSLDIRLSLNGETKQASNTRNLIFKPRQLVSYCSRICTLLPGDIVSTGTPGGIGPMEPGDEVEVYIEDIGSLKNTVRKGGSHDA